MKKLNHFLLEIRERATRMMQEHRSEYSSSSDHPLNGALMVGARERLSTTAPTLKVNAVESITGRGVKAQLDGDTVHIGKLGLFA